MRARALALLLLAPCGAFACTERSSAPREAPVASSPGIASAPNEVPSGHGSTSVSCKADSECPSLPCGPCTPGFVITREALAGPQCTVNPCRHAEAACNEQHVCVVGPKAEKEPSVWRTPPAPR